MLDDPQRFLAILVLAVGAFWLVPYSWPRARALILLLVSSFFVFVVSPGGLASSVLVILTGFAALRLALALGRAIVARVGVALIVGILVGAQWVNGESKSFVVVAGLSYVAFRTIAVLMDVKRYIDGREAMPTLLDFAVLNLFFPVFPAGPIERLQNLNVARLGSAFQPSVFADGMLRILTGILFISYLSEVVLKKYLTLNFPNFFENIASFSAGQILIYCIISLLVLYFNFSGYSSIAVGAGRLFGLSLTENFNYPFVATNIQDFWKRWHITLGEFANRYIFFPLMKLSRGRVAITLVMTFLLVGVWHALNWQFLIWGASHGIALAGYAASARWRASNPILTALRRSYVAAILGWVATMVFVSWAWTFATAPTIGAGFTMTLALLGIR